MNQSIKSDSFLRLFPIRITIAVTLVLTLICYTTLPIYAQNSAEEYFNSGFEKANSGDFEGAIKKFDKAIEINPMFADAYVNRGVVKGYLGDWKAAIEDFNKTIEINPKYAEAYNNRGVAKGELGDWKKAIEDYNKAIELNPKYANAYRNRGLAKGRVGDYKAAIEEYKNCMYWNCDVEDDGALLCSCDKEGWEREYPCELLVCEKENEKKWTCECISVKAPMEKYN